MIAASVHSVGSLSRVKLFRVEDGKEQDITSEAWLFIGRVQWLPDMSGLLAIVGESPGVAQLWFLSYPDGRGRKVTNDLSGYRSIALTADGTRLSTIQSSGLVNIWIAPEGDAKRAVQLPTGNIMFYDVASGGSHLSWIPDGRIAFASNESGKQDIWLMDSDLGHWSPDGRSILYPVNINNVTNIWIQPLDGSPPRQVTDFKDSLMTGFAWTRDGKQLACTRGALLRDAVLISETLKE